jgi:electron-transferring-flavoprotein dehydrogenase
VIVGDAAGLVDVPSLKGIHYAMMSGILAARTIFAALKAEDTSAGGLRSYDEAVRASLIGRDLRRSRNIRLGFKSGFWLGGIKAALMTLTGGAFPGGKITVESDAAEPRQVIASPHLPEEEGLTISKLDGVFKSGNNTRDDMPSHLIVKEDIPPDVARFYEHMCPAAVYEVQDGKLAVNPSNCVDCKTTDILGPRWMTREGGSGTKYQRM